MMRIQKGLKLYVALIIALAGVFFCSNLMAYSGEALRVPMMRGYEPIKKAMTNGEEGPGVPLGSEPAIRLRDLLYKHFSLRIARGEPIEILDVGTGDATFCFRLHNYLRNNGINTNICGIEPQLSRMRQTYPGLIKKAERLGIRLEREWIWGFAETPRPKEEDRYHVIFFNAPTFEVYFMADVREFFKWLDYLLTKQGIAIIRSWTNEPTNKRDIFSAAVTDFLRNNPSWRVRGIEIKEEELQGTYSVSEGLLIERVSPPLTVPRKSELSQSL